MVLINAPSGSRKSATSNIRQFDPSNLIAEKALSGIKIDAASGTSKLSISLMGSANTSAPMSSSEY